MLSGKVAIVTGASSGLGREICLAFTRHGASIVCADRDPSSSVSKQPTHELVCAEGGKCIFVTTDVSNAASVKQLVRDTVDHFGRVDM